MANSRILLAGGRLIDPKAGRIRIVDVLIRNGKVVETGKALRVRGAERIDCKGQYISPGFIDMHCHLREPGYEEAETIATGTRAALAGGFTQVCPMPNTDPPVDSEALVRFEIRQAAEAGPVKVHPIGCCTKGRAGRELAEIGSMHQAGAVAISDDGGWIENPQVMRRVLEYAKAFDILVISHCELAELSDGVANEGLVSTRLGLRGVPDTSEAAAVARDVLLAELVGARLHVAHVSCAKTVDVIRWAKERGVQVTAEVCPHHFTLTDEALEDFDACCRVNPPLRTEADRQAVINGLADGTIDAIATDHAPHPRSEKEVEFDNARPGMIGFETAFSLGYEQLVLTKRLGLVDYIARLTTVPAQILGLPLPCIEPGADADLVVLDPKTNWIYALDQVVSRSSNSPFIGRQLQGRITGAILGKKRFWFPLPCGDVH